MDVNCWTDADSMAVRNLYSLLEDMSDYDFLAFCAGCPNEIRPLPIEEPRAYLITEIVDRSIKADCVDVVTNRVVEYGSVLL